MNYELRIMESGHKKIQTFTDLNTWREAHCLVLMVYKTSGNFPREELFGLTSQIRRAAVSITSNIAEGFSRQSYSEKVQFYSVAQGSNTELQNQLLVVKDIGYINQEEFQRIFSQSVSVHKLLNGLIKRSKNIRNS